MHSRNPHQGRYDFSVLIQSCSALKRYSKKTPNGETTIDFTDEQAVRCLNKALLAHFYQVPYWDIPKDYLCPPIPGRADYIHYIADLLAQSAQTAIPTGKRIKLLDIGTGANCIYPIIGSRSYGWQFKASELDPISVKTANLIVQSNPVLTQHIQVIQQKDAQSIFNGVIKPDDHFDVTLCNPPFHASMQEAEKGSQRKWKNLNKPIKNARNFGGQQAELWCPGGEISFLKRMAKESVGYADQVCWFTSLVSKKDNVEKLKATLQKLNVKQVEVVNMSQGQKVSRFIAWSFLNKAQHKNWAEQLWH